MDSEHEAMKREAEREQAKERRMDELSTTKRYPRRIVIAPAHDLRQKTTITVNSFEEILNAQRNRYEILQDLGQVRNERKTKRIADRERAKRIQERKHSDFYSF